MEMELCDDILDVIASYLTVYERLSILSINKSQRDKRCKVVNRIKKLYKKKSDILYQSQRKYNSVHTLLPDPIYLKEYIETNPEIEKSNDIIEIYKDNILMCKHNLPLTRDPLKAYSVNKLVLLNRNGVKLNDHWWSFDDLEIYLLVMLKHFPEYREDRPNYVMIHTNNKELLKMLRCQVRYDDTTELVVDKLIEHDLFYDEEYQLQVSHVWTEPKWRKTLFSNDKFLLTVKSEKIWVAHAFPQKPI